jgi:outer membrane protein assembly factor BamD
MKRFLWAVALATSVGLFVGCGGGALDPILQLSAEEALAQGKQLLEQGKWLRSREYLIHAFEVEPNSATGREALLLVADSHFQDGGDENFIRAEAKYRDFQNRFPTSEHAAYVQFQIANSLAKRMLRADRDQASARQALESYWDLLRIYPTSEYAEQAQEQILVVKNNLAKSEFLKGYFYVRSVRLPEAAIRRFENIVETYPEYEEMDKVLFYLGRSYVRMRDVENANSAWARLREEYPESPFVRRTSELTPPPEVAEVAEAEAG